MGFCEQNRVIFVTSYLVSPVKLSVKYVLLINIL